jgi:inward rectifier potassium channel
VGAQNVRGRFLSQDGTPNSRKYGLGSQWAERFYLRALNARWPAFLGWMLGGLLLLNGIFALAYTSLGDRAISGSEALGLADPFLRALTFSIGIFTTTGTGPMVAVGTAANWLVITESLVGPLALVACMGVLIARLTRPRMRIRFSESAIVAPYEGGRGLMFRMVNAMPGQVSSVRARVNLVWYENVDGKREREFHELVLERDSVEYFNLHWTVVHPITATSPLRGITPERLHEADAEILVNISALEETFATRVTARTSYKWDEIRWDVKWANIFAHAPDGVIAIDVDRLNRTERLDEGATRAPAAIERVV